jgi:hypothetical protein
VSADVEAPDPERPTSIEELDAYMRKFAAGIFLRANPDGQGARRFSLASLERQHPETAEGLRDIWRRWFVESGRYPSRLTDPAGWEP